MEIILGNEPNNIIRKPTDNYCSSQMPSDNQVSVEQGLEKCKHFTIRDYVSEMRKKDANICIPFSLHNHSPNSPANKPPPLEVKRFRRWFCGRCIHGTISSKTSMESQPMKDTKIIPNKDASTASTSGAKQCVDKLQLNFQEGTPSNLNDKIDVASPSSVLINKDFELVSEKASKESQFPVTESNNLIPDPASKILSSSNERTTTKHPNNVTEKIEQGKEINKLSRRKQGPRNTAKFCTIDDIMRRSVKCKDAKNYVRTKDVLRDTDENPTDRLHLNENKENKREGIPINGGGSRLTHCVKRGPKKRSLPDETHTVNKRENHADGKKIVMLESSGTPRKDKLVQKGSNPVDELRKSNFQPKSIDNTFSGKGSYFRSVTQDKTNNISFVSKKKNKSLLSDCGTTSKIRHTKDALGVKKELRKKQRTIANDIPIDIVELLAKKQQERYSTNSKISSDDRRELSESAENIKNGNQSISLNNEDTQSSNIKGKKQLPFDLNEAPACASTELQTPSPYTGLSMNGSHLSIVDSNTYYSPQFLYGNQTAVPLDVFYPINSSNTSHNKLLGVLDRSSNFPLMNLKQVVNDAGNSSYPTNETISASNLLKIMQRSSSSCIQNEYVWSHDSLRYEYPGSGTRNNQSICKPLPRVGILGPQLQKEITNNSINIAPALGFGTANLNTGSKITTDNLANALATKAFDYSKFQVPAMSRDGAFQPIKNVCKMGECLVNRNPAEDCEYVSEFPATVIRKINPQQEQNGKRSRKIRQFKSVLEG